MFASETQLDLLYLICGLAFLLVAGVTPILNRRTNRLLPWTWLGLFALCRGIYELFSLPMLIPVMPASLEVLRFIPLFLSLIFLMEFGRAGIVTIEGPAPWWLIYGGVAAVVVFVRLTGLADLTMLYVGLSFIGGLWAAWAIFKAAPNVSKGQETLTAAAVIMGLYALATCFPDNSDFFAATMGIPIQLVRGLLALALGISLCRVCRLTLDKTMDPRSLKVYQQLTYGSTIGLLFIAAVGLVGSLGINYLGGKAAREDLAKNQRTAQRLQEIINGEMEKADRLVQLLAGSNRVIAALNNNHDLPAVNQANVLLDRFSQTEEGYGVCYLMNLSGVTIGSSNRNQPDSFLGKNYGFRPYFQQAALGLQGRYFALGVTSRDLGYYTSAPVRNDKGVVVGVAVIKRVIRTVGELRNTFDPNSLSFLVDPHGIIVLANQPSHVLRSLWPLDEEATKEVVEAKQFGSGPFLPLLDQKPADGKAYQLAGERRSALVQPTLMEGWTLFHFGSTQAIPVYRLMGAGALLVLSLGLIGFYVSWDSTSYKAASVASADLSQDGNFISQAQADEDLRQGELKYQALVSNVGLLSEMGDLLQGCHSADEATPVITRFMERLFPDLSGGIYLAQGAGDKFELAGLWGEAPPMERLFGKDDCWALRRGRSYVVEDPGTSLVCHHMPEAFPPGYQCWPIMAQGETLGLFHLRQGRLPGNPRAVSAQQKQINEQLISTVVDQIALTLISLKLREASRTKAS